MDAQEQLDRAAALLLIELAFLIPKGDQAAFDRVKQKLLAYRDAVVAATLSASTPTSPSSGD